MSESRLSELDRAEVVGLKQAPVNDAEAVSDEIGRGLTDTMTADQKRKHALGCIRFLLEYIGDDPDREGLVGTPDRVLRAWDEQFRGYNEDPEDVLGRTFEEVDGYDDMVLLKDVDFDSHCEHHMIPIHGTAHIAYIPSDRVVGLSKLARVVDIFASRLQTQESFTAQIADTIEKVLAPRGLAIVIDASHQCMATRGIAKKRVRTVTTVFRGEFEEKPHLETRFLRLIEPAPGV